MSNTVRDFSGSRVPAGLHKNVVLLASLLFLHHHQAAPPARPAAVPFPPSLRQQGKIAH